MAKTEKPIFIVDCKSKAEAERLAMFLAEVAKNFKTIDRVRYSANRVLVNHDK